MAAQGGGGASSSFNVLEGRVDKRARKEEEETEWGLVDFLGKYHKHIIKSGNPIPGTAVAVDERRERKWTDRLDRIRGKIEEIEETHGRNVRGRVSHATFELKALIQKRVGSTLDRIGGVLEEIDEEVAAIEFESSGTCAEKTDAEVALDREHDASVLGDGEFDDDGALAGLSDAQRAADACAAAAEVLRAAADDRQWWGYVRGRDLWGMEKMFKSGYDRLDAPEPVGGQPAIAVHLAAKHGDVEMLDLLLKYGANANAHNGLGDTAILSCWQFWDQNHAGDRLTQKDHAARARAIANEKTSVALLVELLAHGADANAMRHDRSTALHEAVRRGPVLAVRALLQYGADHEVPDVEQDTPLSIARHQVKADRTSDLVYGDKARFRRRNPDRAEIYKLLRMWPVVRREQKDDEFLQQWDTWMNRRNADGTTQARDLRESASAARVVENTALDICHKQLATSQKVRAYGTPFWSYDAVRRTICCGALRAKDAAARDDMARRFDEGSALAPANHRAPAKSGKHDERRTSMSGAQQQQLKFVTTRHASDRLPLQVPLDRYLLRTASADDAGFTETRDKCSEEEMERARALERVEERAAAKRREERRLVRQRALASVRESKKSGSRPNSRQGTLGLLKGPNVAHRPKPTKGSMSAIYGSSTEQRRTAAALSFASDGVDEKTIRRGATASALLFRQREKPPTEAGGATLINRINTELAELRAYGKLTGARERAAALNPLAVARAAKIKGQRGRGPKDALGDDMDIGDSGSVLVAIGEARRRKAAVDRRFNAITDLPPRRRAMRFQEDLPPQMLPPEARKHKSWSWAAQWPPDEANKVSEATRNDLSRLFAIINETEEAVNLQQRPVNPDMVVQEQVSW